MIHSRGELVTDRVSKLCNMTFENGVMPRRLRDYRDCSIVITKEGKGQSIRIEGRVVYKVRREKSMQGY